MKERTKPSKADLIALRDAYIKFKETAIDRAADWNNWGKHYGKNLNYYFDCCDKADKDALKPVQQAWIKATSYVNSADRWLLVSEGMILTMLVEAKLWPAGPCVSEWAYQQVNGPR